MPVFSVSCKNSDLKRIEHLDVGKSRIFQIGVEIAVNGGLYAVTEKIKQVDRLQKELSDMEKLKDAWYIRALVLGRHTPKKDDKKIEKEVETEKAKRLIKQARVECYDTGQ